MGEGEAWARDALATVFIGVALIRSSRVGDRLVRLGMCAAGVVALLLAPLQGVIARQAPLRLYSLRHIRLADGAHDQGARLGVHGFQQAFIVADVKMLVQQRDAEAFQLAVPGQHLPDIGEAIGVTGFEIVIHPVHIGQGAPLHGADNDLS